MEINPYSRTSFYKDGSLNKLRTIDESNGRGIWWQHTIRNTPLPGAYDVPTFLEEGQSRPVKRTYGFHNSGRQRNADPSLTGSCLLPGLYSYNDLAKELSRKPCSSSFRGPGRQTATPTTKQPTKVAHCGGGIGPGSYDISSTADELQRNGSGNYHFNSKSKRFPTAQLAPKEGPSPAQYDAGIPSRGIAMSSSFQSRTPRFVKPHQLRTPGPGAYTRLSCSSQSAAVKHLGRYHGLFFPVGST